MTAPTIEVYRNWDRGRDYAWGAHRYHWDGGAWIVVPDFVYSVRGAGYGTSSTLRDDVGENNGPDEVYVSPRVTQVEIGGASLTYDVQRRLARRGYYHGPIDGIAGPGTRSAIAAFEADNGLERNGLMTRKVITTLGL